ncbi:MAG: hypothetical protein ACREQ5_08090, partial [Candidatus Dormibacteria bacterium]
MAINIEDGLPIVKYNGLNTAKAANLSGVTIDTSGNTVVPGTLSVTGATTVPVNSSLNANLQTHTPVAVNVTATASAAQVATGYITSTSAAAVTITLPTGTLLGAA